MDEVFPDHFEVDIAPEDPVYIIGIVSELVGIPIWTLRKLDEMGIVKPKRIGNKTRCYSMKQVKKLKYVCFLMEEKQVNLNGIKIILEMERE